MSERQKDRIVKLVRELLKETPTRVSAVEILRAAVDEIDEKERRRRARRRQEYRGYLKKYGAKEGRRRWRSAHYDLVMPSRRVARRH